MHQPAAAPDHRPQGSRRTPRDHERGVSHEYYFRTMCRAEPVVKAVGPPTPPKSLPTPLGLPSIDTGSHDVRLYEHGADTDGTDTPSLSKLSFAESMHQPTNFENEPYHIRSMQF